VGHTVDELLEQIKSHDRFSLSTTARPAVLNEIISNISSSVGFANPAIDNLMIKIEVETLPDIRKLLSEMRSDFNTLRFFHSVASGQHSTFKDTSVDQFISLLCGQYPATSTLNSSPRRLLLPYSSVFQNLLTESGELTAVMENVDANEYLFPRNYVHAVVDFFAEYHYLLSPQSKKTISQAMMKRAHTLKIGVPLSGKTDLKEITNMREFFMCPMTRDLRIHNHVSTNRNFPTDPVAGAKLVEIFIKKERNSNSEPGIYLNRAFRDLSSHKFAEFSASLSRCNWNLGDVFSLMRVAATTLQKENIDWVVFNEHGWPTVTQNDKFLQAKAEHQRRNAKTIAP
jgi:hypothetical protein